MRPARSVHPALGLIVATMGIGTDAHDSHAAIQQIYTLPYQGQAYISCGFGCYGGHAGTDYVLGTYGVGGHPVLAAARGTAKPCARTASAGYSIVLDHYNGHRTRYLHFNSPALPANGQIVARGQPVGYEGNDGLTDPPGFYHLHFETRHNATTFSCGYDGTAVNPYHSSTFMWKTNPPSMAMDMDWSGDGRPDVLARKSDGTLCRFDGNGANGWIPNPDPPCGDGTSIGTGWGVFNAIIRPGDFSGDGCHDILGRDGAGGLILYYGNCAGGFLSPNGNQVGSGWGNMSWLLGTGDFSGDGLNDILGRWTNGDMCLFRGNGYGGWIPHPDPYCGDGKRVGTGWNVFAWLVEPRDWGGGGCMDVMAELSDGYLNLYQGNCTEGWGPTLYGIGSEWNAWEAMVGTGDFTGDGCPDILARKIVGSPDLYSWGGNCAGGWTGGTGIGFGWWAFDKLF